MTSEPEQPLLADEPPGFALPPTPSTAPAAPAAPEAAAEVHEDAPLALAAMPAGVEVGTFVHRVMEATDFAAPDIDAELAARIAEVQGRRAVDVGPVGPLVAGLRAVLETPLGPVLGDRRLRDVRAPRPPRRARLRAAAGRRRPAQRVADAQRIADVLRAHTGAGDPLAAYAERLDDARLRQSVRGYLTGSLDLVVRISDSDDPDPARPGLTPAAVRRP